MLINATARRNGPFYVVFAGLALLAVLVGFAPTYYLQPYFGTPALSPLLHVHGALFSSWLVLLATQTALARTGQLAFHRQLGWLGTAIASAMVIVGTYVTLERAPLHSNSMFFYATGLGDMIMFAAFAGTAIALRRRSDVHKRLMILATVTLLDAGVGRWPIVTPLFQEHRTLYTIEMDLLADAFLGIAMAYDWFRDRRVHATYLWGGAILLASQVVRILLDL